MKKLNLFIHKYFFAVNRGYELKIAQNFFPQSYPQVFGLFVGNCSAKV